MAWRIYGTPKLRIIPTRDHGPFAVGTQESADGVEGGDEFLGVGDVESVLGAFAHGDDEDVAVVFVHGEGGFIDY